MFFLKVVLIILPLLICISTFRQENDAFKSKMAYLGDIPIQYMDFGGSGIPWIWVQDLHNYFKGIYQDSIYHPFLKELTEDYQGLAPKRRGYEKSTATP